MSTFRGFMPEFPDIRVDYFRPIPGRSPPLACFLSHIHADHIVGLDAEGFKSPFVYCSSATKEMLLRLEKRTHRMNFALGVLEARRQRYRHLKNLLKPVPLETPTQIELAPGNAIKVTLFDANHCTGAVMFLIEGNGSAVLYTGDIRSEPWFVNSLVRNPFLVEYTSGLKTLDCIYLDTSNTGPASFPTKAEGLKELLEKVSRYPNDTIFYFSAWTYGYEEVWMALSKALGSPIHVDKYKLRMYLSLGNSAFLNPTAAALIGYKCGNTHQEGCLTSSDDARLHSCEKGTHCRAIDQNTVWIKPIITRNRNGDEVEEIGIGGGMGDLLDDNLELNAASISEMLALLPKTEEPLVEDVRKMLVAGLDSTRKALSLDDLGLKPDEASLSLEELGAVLIRNLKSKSPATKGPDLRKPGPKHDLPRTIKFPYSRHSSYPELCHLVKVFKPKDVYPCTVDEACWHEGVSMETLFGEHCSGSDFRHDREMRERLAAEGRILSSQSQTSVSMSSPFMRQSSPVLGRLPPELDAHLGEGRIHAPSENTTISSSTAIESLRRKATEDDPSPPPKRPRLTLSIPSHAPDLASSSPEDEESSDGEESSGEENSDSEDDLLDEHPEWDSEDKVWRCSECRHEIWRSKTRSGYCTGCGAGENAYMEESESWHAFPRLFFSEYTPSEYEYDSARVAAEFPDHLDYQSSAYDSLDEGSLDEEYEKDSFIDDSSSHGDAEEEKAPSDDEDYEADYKKMYERLQEQHQSLHTRHSNLITRHEAMRQDFLGTDYDEDDEDDDDEPMDSEDYDMSDDELFVEVAVPQPVVTEVVLSQSFRSNANHASQSQQPALGPASRPQAPQVVSNEPAASQDSSVIADSTQKSTWGLEGEANHWEQDASRIASSQARWGLEGEAHHWEQDRDASGIVISQAGEQSQNSELDDSRLGHRMQAFEAADDEEGAGWHGISLLSTVRSAGDERAL